MFNEHVNDIQRVIEQLHEHKGQQVKLNDGFSVNSKSINRNAQGGGRQGGNNDRGAGNNKNNNNRNDRRHSTATAGKTIVQCEKRSKMVIIEKKNLKLEKMKKMVF